MIFDCNYMQLASIAECVEDKTTLLCIATVRASAQKGGTVG